MYQHQPVTDTEQMTNISEKHPKPCNKTALTLNYISDQQLIITCCSHY